VAHRQEEQVEGSRLAIGLPQAPLQCLRGLWVLAEPVVDNAEGIPPGARELPPSGQTGVALRLVELLAEALEFHFQFGDAAIALLTAGTDGTSQSHEAFPKIE
jgi:hypothetical protein